MGLKENIKKYRLENNMTLEDVSKKIGITPQTIQKYEKGTISNIPQERIEKLAEVFHISPSELMGWNEERMQYLRENRNTAIIQRLLGFMGCKIEVKWSELEGNFIEPVGYTVEYNDTSFDITAEEFTELINNIKSYIRFKINELLEINSKRQITTSNKSDNSINSEETDIDENSKQ